jgi:hypothetical protein
VQAYGFGPVEQDLLPSRMFGRHGGSGSTAFQGQRLPLAAPACCLYWQAGRVACVLKCGLPGGGGGGRGDGSRVVALAKRQ